MSWWTMLGFQVLATLHIALSVFQRNFKRPYLGQIFTDWDEIWMADRMDEGEHNPRHFCRGAPHMSQL